MNFIMAIDVIMAMDFPTKGHINLQKNMMFKANLLSFLPGNRPVVGCGVVAISEAPPHKEGPRLVS